MMAALTHPPPTGILRTKSEPASSVRRDLHGRRNAICFLTAPRRLERRNAICEALDSVSVHCLTEFRFGRMTLWTSEGGGETPTGFDGIAFDAFFWSETDIFKCLRWLLCDSELFRSYCFDESVVTSFITQVRMGYAKYSNPYHCFRHAFDVTQFCYLLLCVGDARRMLTADEALGLIIAAICHDLEHPGTDFAFQDVIKSHLSTEYHGYESPLETHHLTCMMMILNDPDSDLLAHLPEERRRRVLEVIRECILATDMARHNEILSAWRGMSGTNEKMDADRSSVNLMLLRLLIKMADISNVCRPWPVSVQWSQKLIDELMRVHDSVIGLGHVPNSFLNSVASEPDKVVSSFAVNVARPLLETVIEVLPLTRPLLAVLDSNMVRWNQGDHYVI